MATPTGYPKGRPRKGEIRPLTKAVLLKRIYDRANALNPAYMAKRAELQRERRAFNPGRVALYAAKYRNRCTAWANSHGEFTTTNTKYP